MRKDPVTKYCELLLKIAVSEDELKQVVNKFKSFQEENEKTKIMITLMSFPRHLRWNYFLSIERREFIVELQNKLKYLGIEFLGPPPVVDVFLKGGAYPYLYIPA